MLRLFVLLMALSILSTNSWAANPSKHPAHRKLAPVRSHSQMPFSFIPPYQPSATLRQLQAPLTARVVQTQAILPSQPIRPKYTQIFLTPAQLAALTSTPSSIKPNHATKRGKRWQWQHVDYTERSWVASINRDQAKTLAGSITQFLVRELSPESTSLLLAMPPKSQAHNPFTEQLTENLRKAGFALVEQKKQAPQAQLIRYEVNPLETGFWVKLQLPNLESSRFFTISPDNQIVATSPFSVRSLSK